MTIGPDCKPHVKEFGNVKAGKNIAGGYLGIQKPQITTEREPLSDITSIDKEVKVLLERPGIRKEDIKINAYKQKIEVKTANNSKKIQQGIEPTQRSRY